MQQTMLPNKIILNLESSLLSQPLPVTLQKLINRGLEINEVEDIRSYKKLIPTLKKYPDAIIITIDDDLLYDHDLVERLFQSYLKNPKSISAMRTHTIAFNKSGYPLNYSDWYYEQAVSDNPFHLFPTTGAGTLFPPGVFNKEVFNQEVFTTLCPTADDIWFHAMAVMNKTSIIKVVSRSNTGCDYLVNDSVQDMGLFHQNTGEKGRNDIQLKNVYSKYNIYSLLNSSNVD